MQQVKPIPLHHCNPAATAAHNEKSETSPDSANNSYNTHLYLSNNLSHCKLGITQKPVQKPVSASMCSSDPGVAVGQDPKSADSPHTSEPDPHLPPNSPLQVQNTCSGMQWDKNSHTGELMAVGVKIRAVDTKLLDVPELRVPCRVLQRVCPAPTKCLNHRSGSL